MRNDNHRHPELPVNVPQHTKHILGHIGVQFPRGLVGQQQRGAVGQGHRDGHALLLAAGQLRRIAPAFVGHMQRCQQLPGALPPLPPAGAGNGLRQLNVVPHIKIRHQIAPRSLPHKAHLPAPVRHQLPVADVQQIPLAHPNAPGRGPFQPRQNVQQRSLARPAGAHYAHQLAGRNRQVNPAQRHHFQIRRLVNLEQVAGRHIGRRVCRRRARIRQRDIGQRRIRRQGIRRRPIGRVG